ncbi:PKD domain-containing protein [Flavobacterium sp.]|uniref:PKD domain-containing protein n=1 Tax=Flavobacterium sp. TaxID=239 RepID=UPI00286E0C74|nr:PKD domain-containing protein [Flavobacterium sp.]
MKLTLSSIFILLLICHSELVEGQIKVKDTTTRRATIAYDKKGNQVSLRPETPPLVQIAGAPKPFYTHFWEMGDGHYSKEVTPKHIYKKKGNYKVNLQVTNNYDNGKAPATRPKTVAINEIEDNNYAEIASIGDTINYKIFNNRDPIPDEEMVVVVSYQNLLDYVASGKLYLFYNDKEFKNKNFELIDFRTHNEEKEIKELGIAAINDINNSNLYVASEENISGQKSFVNNKETDLDQEILLNKTLFHNMNLLEFENLNPKETRNLFFTFKTTPEMIKDTSATVKMRGVFVPDRNYKNYKKKTLEMEIVTSHDPNKMSSNGSFMNYRLVRFKTLKFKTKFQNNGEGPARMIRLETDIPDMLDKKTFKVVDMYPKCPICPKDELVTYSCLDTIIKKEQIHFTFKNIYLPGSAQKNVTEKDSTKGFVKYTMKFSKDFHKTKTKSRTSIFFDKNEPIITNYATTRFLPGLSYGVKTGYNYFPKLENSKAYFLGFTLSPYKSYRWYWQIELVNQVLQYNPKTTVKEELLQGTVGVRQLLRTTTTFENKTINLEVPVLMRFNINNYIGVGAGLQANINASEKVESRIKEDLYEGQAPTFILKTKTSSSENKESFNGLKTGLLFDFTAGFARIGPSLGARYVVNFKENYSYWQFYGIWKF